MMLWNDSPNSARKSVKLWIYCQGKEVPMAGMSRMQCSVRGIWDRNLALPVRRVWWTCMVKQSISTPGRNFHSEILVRELPDMVKVSRRYSPTWNQATCSKPTQSQHKGQAEAQAATRHISHTSQLTTRICNIIMGSRLQLIQGRLSSITGRQILISIELVKRQVILGWIRGLERDMRLLRLILGLASTKSNSVTAQPTSSRHLSASSSTATATETRRAMMLFRSCRGRDIMGVVLISEEWPSSSEPHPWTNTPISLN